MFVWPTGSVYFGHGGVPYQAFRNRQLVLNCVSCAVERGLKHGKGVFWDPKLRSVYVGDWDRGQRHGAVGDVGAGVPVLPGACADHCYRAPCFTEWTLLN